MQMASLFTSMQQVEIRRRKEGETIEEYNRHKSLANLTKARFMKQMEKITKELKKDTLLTHNYSIPKPTNQTVLTNTLSQKTPNNILIPDIETNVQEQLNHLGISNLLPTATKKPNKESSQTASPSTRSLQHENSTTTRQSTGKLNKLLREKLRQQSKEDLIQVSPLPDKNVGNFPMTMEHSGKQEQDKHPASINHIYAEQPQKNNAEKLKSNQEEEDPIQVSPLPDKNVGNFPMTMEHSGKQEQDKHPSSINHIYAEQPQKNNAEKLKSNQEEEDPIQVSQLPDKNVGNFPMTMEHSGKQEQDKHPASINHIYAEQPQKNNAEKVKSNQEEEEDKEYENLETTDDEEPETTNTKHKRHKPTKPARINHKQHRRAYPWAHTASNNATKKTNLAHEIEYIRHPKIHNILTDQMKKKLIKKVNLPEDISQEIDKEIQEMKDSFLCKICSNSFSRRYFAYRHTKIEMGYHEYRCSFCNYLSNSTNCVYHHYVTRHGIPKDWITLQNLTNFITDSSDINADY